MVVRATSPKVPICGRPDGPYPVSNSTSSFGFFFSRATIAFACSNGQALDCSASARKAEGSDVDILRNFLRGHKVWPACNITVIASEAKQSTLALLPDGLLRCARNDEI